MSTKIDTVLVTGGSSGLGFEISKAFLSKGSNVVLNGSNDKKLREAAEKLGNPSKVSLVAGDIGRKETSQKMVALAVERFGRVDILVNNAGVFSPKPFLEVDENELDKFLNINLKGTYFASQAAIAQMLKQEGGAYCAMYNLTQGRYVAPFVILTLQGLTLELKEGNNGRVHHGTTIQAGVFTIHL